jgi:hypothetical protein
MVYPVSGGNFDSRSLGNYSNRLSFVQWDLQFELHICEDDILKHQNSREGGGGGGIFLFKHDKRPTSYR